MAGISVHEKRFSAAIYVHRKEFRCSDPLFCISWEGLRFDLFNKYQWYFRFRAALVQIKVPRQYVELKTWNYPYTPSNEQILINLKNKLKGAKAKVTKIQNQMQLAKENHNTLFPIEQDPLWKKAEFKLAKAKIDFIKISEDLKECLK